MSVALIALSIRPSEHHWTHVDAGLCANDHTAGPGGCQARCKVGYIPFSNGSARLSLFLSLFTFAPPQGLVFLLVSFLFRLHSKFVLREFYLGFVGSHSRGFADEAFRLVETHSPCGVLHVFRRTVFRGQPIFIEQTPGLMARLGDAFKLHIIDSVLDCCNVVYVGYSPLCCVWCHYSLLSYPATCVHYFPSVV